MANVDSVVTKIVTPQDELLQMMEPFNDMASQLGCAPLSIAVLGQLCLISCQKDFDLRVEGGNNNFNHLQFPESFRACLSQVAQSGYRAFLTADSTMQSIKMKSARVPGLMKVALTILYGKDSEPEDVQTFLPIKLGAIRDVAEGCTKEAEKVVLVFNNVIDLLSELECSTLRKQGKVKDAEEVERLKIQIEKGNAERLERIAKENKEEVEKVKKEVEEAKKDWKESMDEMPSMGDYLQGALVQGVTDIIGAATNIVSLYTFQSSSNNSHQQTNIGEAKEAETKSDGIDELNDAIDSAAGSKRGKGKKEKLEHSEVRRCLAKAEEFLTVLSLCTDFFEEEADGEISLNVSAIERSSKGAKEIECTVENCSRTVDEKEGADSLRKVLLQNMDNTTEMVKDLKTIPGDKHIIKKLYEQFTNTSEKTEDLVSCMKSLSGASQYTRSGPGMAAAKQDDGKKSINEKMQETAHKKVELSRAELDSRRKAADEANKRRLETQNELMRSMHELQNFQHEHANSIEILKVIQKGLEAFAKLREQWTQLILFFQSISNLIGNSLAPELNAFIMDADKMSKMDKSTKMAKEVVYQSAFQSVKVASIVNHLSDCYCMISKAHLIPLTNELFKLLALDKDDDKSKIQVKKMELDDKSQAAHEAIKSIVDQKHREYQLTCDQRVKAIDQEMKKIAPKSDAEVEKIREKAEKMVLKVTAVEEDEEQDFSDFV